MPAAQRKNAKAKAAVEAKKPDLPALDPLAAAQEQAKHAMEGNRKLGLAVEALRAGLETVAGAEFDNETRLPVTAVQLRQIAVAALDAYSQAVGQNWRRNPIIGSRAGDRNLSTLEAGNG